MSMDHFSKIDFSKIYPPFLEKAEILIDNCYKAGSEYWIISGYRSVDEQNKLYAQGRNAIGKVIDPKLVVTNARGGSSFHQYGVALDACSDKDMTRAGLQPDWNEASYKVLAEEAKKLGLEPGFYWKFKDSPHFQLDFTLKGIPVSKLYEKYQKGGIPAVWAFLDQWAW